MVTLVDSKWNLISYEIVRWYKILKPKQGFVTIPL